MEKKNVKNNIKKTIAKKKIKCTIPLGERMIGNNFHEKQNQGTEEKKGTGEKKETEERITLTSDERKTIRAFLTGGNFESELREMVLKLTKEEKKEFMISIKKLGEEFKKPGEKLIEMDIIDQILPFLRRLKREGFATQEQEEPIIFCGILQKQVEEKPLKHFEILNMRKFLELQQLVDQKDLISTIRNFFYTIFGFSKIDLKIHDDNKSITFYDHESHKFHIDLSCEVYEALIKDLCLFKKENSENNLKPLEISDDTFNTFNTKENLQEIIGNLQKEGFVLKNVGISDTNFFSYFVQLEEVKKISPSFIESMNLKVTFFPEEGDKINIESIKRTLCAYALANHMSEIVSRFDFDTSKPEYEIEKDDKSQITFRINNNNIFNSLIINLEGVSNEENIKKISEAIPTIKGFKLSFGEENFETNLDFVKHLIECWNNCDMKQYFPHISWKKSVKPNGNLQVEKDLQPPSKQDVFFISFSTNEKTFEIFGTEIKCSVRLETYEREIGSNHEDLESYIKREQEIDKTKKNTWLTMKNQNDDRKKQAEKE